MCPEPLVPTAQVGVWVYDHPTAEPPAQFAGIVADFNARATAPGRIDHVVLYGSDMEIYPNSFCCSPLDSAQMGRRLNQYGQHPNSTLTFIIDGRMDGDQEWAPDLSTLPPAKIVAWARWTAQWVCAYERIDGVQLDLEPIAGPWNANLRLLFSSLSSRLASRDFGCVSPRRPKGVALSTFAMAKDVDVALFEALGPQGYVVVSGYDLAGGGAGTSHSPAEYEAALRGSLASIRQTAAAANRPYMVGIPAAASTHEFESFVVDGNLVESGHTQLGYVQAALRALTAVADDTRFLGPMLWTLCVPPPLALPMLAHAHILARCVAGRTPTCTRLARTTRSARPRPSPAPPSGNSWAATSPATTRQLPRPRAPSPRSRPSSRPRRVPPPRTRPPTRQRIRRRPSRPSRHSPHSRPRRMTTPWRGATRAAIARRSPDALAATARAGGTAAAARSATATRTPICSRARR